MIVSINNSIIISIIIIIIAIIIIITIINTVSRICGLVMSVSVCVCGVHRERHTHTLRTFRSFLF